MQLTPNKQNSADRAQGLRYFAYFRTLVVIGMANYVENEYRTDFKAEADIHAGGNFFWLLYKDQLILNSNSTAQLKRIYYRDNGHDIKEEKIILEGTHNPPVVGFYMFELELKNSNIRYKYCCEIVNNDKLICHGFYQLKDSDSFTYRTELFNVI